MNSFKLPKLAILGPGLIGGSLLLACRARNLASQISVYARQEETLREIAARDSTVSLHLSAAEAVRNADLILLCVPIDAMSVVMSEALPELEADGVVTDVGSVKSSVVRELEPLLKGRAHWIGSHPMAGREQTGFSAARADLFENATTILTPTESTSPRAQNLVHEFWLAVGCRHILRFSPEEHDRLVAQISHLPHLVAAALTQSASRESLVLSGPGFRDTTRIASGPAEMWRDILIANRHEVGAALDQLIAILQQARTALTQSDENALQELLTRANHVRQNLTKT